LGWKPSKSDGQHLNLLLYERYHFMSTITETFFIESDRNRKDAKRLSIQCISFLSYTSSFIEPYN
jgi:hypothetical protein